ncbi:hypothetical protein EYF80_027231 [Liparis tanakae]|uniref:Uncharacterized protein n=1 Tax=Liparis tanakae TaxID=230148 RepID=A0A4Z2H9H5_9TELE|nr:hypothetical protein EYF80_027231 [Liparis tanakae]
MFFGGNWCASPALNFSWALCLKKTAMSAAFCGRMGEKKKEQQKESPHVDGFGAEPRSRRQSAMHTGEYSSGRCAVCGVRRAVTHAVDGSDSGLRGEDPVVQRWLNPGDSGERWERILRRRQSAGLRSGLGSRRQRHGEMRDFANMALRPLPAVRAGQMIRQFSATYGYARLINEPTIQADDQFHKPCESNVELQKSGRAANTNNPRGEALQIAILHTEKGTFCPGSSGEAVGVSVVRAFAPSGHFVECVSISLPVVRHHQSSHLCLGFMGASALQPKCLENSCELEMVPMTRNRDGLWGSVMTPSCELSGVLTEHQTCRHHRGQRRLLSSRSFAEGGPLHCAHQESEYRTSRIFN